VRVFLTISTIMSVILISCLAVLDPCRAPLQARLQIPDSPWEIVSRWSSCGGFDTGMTLIVAKNRVNGKIVRVANLEGDAGVDLSVDAARRLVLTLAAPTELRGKLDKFDDVAVVYEFQASDPRDREGYRLWLDHHDDPQAIAWCRSKGWSPFYCDPR
jgi:hypothetical protein